MGRKTLPGGGSPISIRVSDQLKTDLSKAAEGLGLSEHDTLRLAMQIGFKHFAAIDHDLAAAIIAKSGLLPKPNIITPHKPTATVYEYPSDSGFKIAEEHHKDEGLEGLH